MSVRKIAYEILKNVFIDNLYAGLLLRNRLKTINEKDKFLITKIVYGTIRNYRLLNYQYQDLLKSKTDKATEVLLMMSIYQLFMMDKIPEYAIVNEAVKLSNKKGLINAVLRKVIKRGMIEPDDIAVKYSLPDFIYKMWLSHYDSDVIKIAENMLNEAVVFGRINTLKTSKEKLAQDLNFNFIDDISFTYNANLTESTYFKEGEVIIQDYSSQQVCKYLDLKEHQKVLDVCSAPGGKTSQIAMYLNNTGEITAVDIHQHRLHLIENLNKLLGIKNVKCVLKDAVKLEIDDKFDRILVDVPCSGLGVLKGKADIKLKIKPDDIDEIIKIQKDILNASADKLKPGGILVYSTCTLNKKENEKQIEAFLKNNLNYKLLAEKCIMPYEFNSDGFYMAKLIREE